MRRLIRLLLYILILCLIPYLIPVNAREQRFDQKPFPESRFIDVNGIMIHLREWNESKDTTVILISGFGGSTYTWRHTIPVLMEKGFHVIAVDPPPFGYSSKKDGVDHSVSYNASLIWKALDHLKHNEVILVGHSMGGAIAASMADTLPHLVKRIVYVDGGAYHKNTALSFFRFPPLKRWAEVIGHYFIFRPSVFKRITASAFGREPLEEEIRNILAPFLYENSASSVLDAAASADKRKLSDQFRKIPSLVIWGTNDNWLKPEICDQFRSTLTDVVYKPIEGAGHCPMETHPEVFNEYLSSYLSEKP